MCHMVPPFGLAGSMETHTAYRVTASPGLVAQPLGAWHMEAAMCAVAEDN